MSKLAKHSVPGWSQNVQINAGRDVNIYNGCKHPQPIIDRNSYAPAVAFNASKVFARIGALAGALVDLLAAGLQLCAWIVFGSMALTVWLLGRVANLVLIVERRIGGGPKQLIYVPSVLQRDVPTTHQLEADLDHDIYTDSSTAPTVYADRAR